MPCLGKVKELVDKTMLYQVEERDGVMVSTPTERKESMHQLFGHSFEVCLHLLFTPFILIYNNLLLF